MGRIYFVDEVPISLSHHFYNLRACKMASKGLYYNINKRKKEGKAPLKPTSKNYPTDKAFEDSAKTAKEEYTAEEKKGSMKTARKNVGADKCWTGWTAQGTKKKDGKTVPNCVKEKKTFGDFCVEAEGIAEQSGDGYLGPRRLGIKNPLASDATRSKADAAAKATAKKNLKTGSAPKGGLMNRLQGRADMIDAMREDVTIEDADGNVVAEIVDLIKPEPMTGWKQQVMADIRPENQDYFQEVLNLKKQTWGMS